VAKVKSSESGAGFESELELENGRHIIKAEPSPIVSTTKIHLSELDDQEEVEHLFHSQM
jgi:hypothetical protein